MVKAERGTEVENEGSEYEERLNVYNHMAYYVAEKLHLRPLDILTKWSPAELIVAYGHYANLVALENFSMWEKTKSGEMPKKQFVKFMRR